MSDHKVLSINTYAGSLLLAAKEAKLEVVASLEDSGFGTDLQQLNFPKVPAIATQAEWPEAFDHPWDKLLVIAHPPCAAFSNQNQQKTKRGVDAGSFQCHHAVLDYALGHGCASLAIESVPGTIAAASVYTDAATKYGYQVYFIKQNAVSFGVPQWRPRLWMIFTKTDTLRVNFKPRYIPLDRVVTFEGSPTSPTSRNVAPCKKCSKALEEMEDEWMGHLLPILQAKHGLPNSGNQRETREKYGLVGFFMTALPRWLDPTGFATTVLEESYWFIGKQELTREDISAVMGFPRNYKWGKRERDFRRYLSKGICPPVGAWVLKQMLANVTGQYAVRFGDDHVVMPATLLDLQPTRKDAEAAARKNSRLQGSLL